VKFSTQEDDVRPHYVVSTVKLVFMPNLAIPDFLGEIVTSTTIWLPTAIHFAAKEMIKKILARFWDTKFKNSIFRLIPLSELDTKDEGTAHATIARAPYCEKGENQCLVHATRAYLYKTDRLLMDMEWENNIMHEGFTASTQCNQILESEVQRRSWNYTNAYEMEPRASMS
jgi:hypothetical protein